jgi:hypothetical protein
MEHPVVASPLGRGLSVMDSVEIAISFVIGFAGGYVLRAVISAVRRRKAYRWRQERARRAEVEAARLLSRAEAPPLYTALSLDHNPNP